MSRPARPSWTLPAVRRRVSWLEQKAANPKLARAALDACAAILERPDLRGVIVEQFQTEAAELIREPGADPAEQSEPGNLPTG